MRRPTGGPRRVGPTAAGLAVKMLSDPPESGSLADNDLESGSARTGTTTYSLNANTELADTPALGGAGKVTSARWDGRGRHKSWSGGHGRRGKQVRVAAAWPSGVRTGGWGTTGTPPTAGRCSLPWVSGCCRRCL